jgi:sec-independent protein translocase protein TatB
MFGIGPMEFALFLVIVLLVVGPEKLPSFMRTVGKALRQVRSASREFKDAIGLDDLLRDGDPFRAPPIRPPRARPVPLEGRPSAPAAADPAAAPSADENEGAAPASSDLEKRAAAADQPDPEAESDGGAKAEPS